MAIDVQVSHKFHEVVHIWPKMQTDEFAKLVADIKEHGLREPIWTYQDKIIDGRHRYLACEKAGVEPQYREWDGQGSLVMFVASLNQHRRHLDAGQKAMVALEIEKHLSEEADKRMKAGKALDPVQSFEQGLSGRASEQAAKVTGTNRQYVVDAKRVVERAPELKPLVMDGVISLPDAKKLSTEPAEVRQKVVAKVASGQVKRVKEAVKEVRKEEKQAEVAHLQMVDVTPVVIQQARMVEQGQLWQLGQHILYCGDSASQEFRTRAFGAASGRGLCALAFADPPYNAGVAEWDRAFQWDHDYLASIAPVVAVTPGIVSIQSFMCKTQMPYRWSMAYWLDNGMTRGALGFGNWIYVALFANNSIYRNKQDFERVSISSKDRDELDHKGRKPLAMMHHLIKTFTEEGNIILDTFLGTGTTLMVCEQSKRICVGAEVNPEYCTSIIKRWESATGQEAVLWQ